MKGKKRKTAICFVLWGCLMSACGDKETAPEPATVDSIREVAARMYDEVQNLYDDGHYLEARLWADSLRTSYPKAVEVRRKLLTLSPYIDLGLASDSLRMADSLLAEARGYLSALQREFHLEKAPTYQSVGYYMDPLQKSELTHRTCLKAQVDEQGEITLISVVHGVRVFHRKLLLTADGQKQNATHCFSFITTETEGHEEEASFRYGPKIIGFFRQVSGPVTVQCKGEETNYSYQLSVSDQKALLHCLNLWEAYQKVKKQEQLAQHLSNQVRFYTMKIEKHGY